MEGGCARVDAKMIVVQETLEKNNRACICSIYGLHRNWLLSGGN